MKTRKKKKMAVANEINMDAAIVAVKDALLKAAWIMSRTNKSSGPLACDRQTFQVLSPIPKCFVQAFY